MTVTSIRRPRTPKAPVAPTLAEIPNGLRPQEVQAPDPAPAPVTPEPQVAEIAQVTTRYTHPVYIASQHKLVHPGEICPVIVDGWVRHQLDHQQGSLIRS